MNERAATFDGNARRDKAKKSFMIYYSIIIIIAARAAPVLSINCYYFPFRFPAIRYSNNVYREREKNADLWSTQYYYAAATIQHAL
jgi:hypothetical protein